MITTLHTEWTVGDVCKGFIFDKTRARDSLALMGSSLSNRSISVIISMETENAT